MTKAIEDKLDKIPVLNLVVRFLKKVKLPGFKGLSIYDLLEMYTIGIVEGALTTRASAIAFSFFITLGKISTDITNTPSPPKPIIGLRVIGL